MPTGFRDVDMALPSEYILAELLKDLSSKLAQGASSVRYVCTSI